MVTNYKFCKELDSPLCLGIKDRGLVMKNFPSISLLLSVFKKINICFFVGIFVSNSDSWNLPHLFLTNKTEDSMLKSSFQFFRKRLVYKAIKIRYVRTNCVVLDIVFVLVWALKFYYLLQWIYLYHTILKIHLIFLSGHRQT